MLHKTECCQPPLFRNPEPSLAINMIIVDVVKKGNYFSQIVSLAYLMRLISMCLFNWVRSPKLYWCCCQDSTHNYLSPIHGTIVLTFWCPCVRTSNVPTLTGAPHVRMVPHAPTQGLY